MTVLDALTDARAVATTLAEIRKRRPLIHNITNLVVTNTTANALLALGASPAMVEGSDEVAEFARISEAVVINLGTMSSPRAAAIRLAVASAAEAGRPWVMDPVAVGAISYRTRLARDLLELRPTAIRGNASEVMALAGEAGSGKGVDSTAQSDAAISAARTLAQRTGGAVAVTGVVDYVADAEYLVEIHNGHEMMTRVTGMGCTATAIIGACLGVGRDGRTALVHGLVIAGIAGEIAAARARGPGSMQVEFLDALYHLSEAELTGRARLVLRAV